MSPRRSLLVVGAVIGSAALAGCSYNSPQTTATPYAASDGIVANLDSVGLRNVMVVSAAKDKPGQLYGSLVNSGSTAQKVTFTSDAGSMPTVTVPAGKVVNLAKRPVKLSSVPVMPGENLAVTVAAGGTSQKLSVPVLDGTLPEYRTLVPSAGGKSSSAKTGASPKSSGSSKSSSSTSAGQPTSTSAPETGN